MKKIIGSTNIFLATITILISGVKVYAPVSSNIKDSGISTLKSSATSKAYDGHFPWEDSEYIVPTKDVTHFQVTEFNNFVNAMNDTTSWNVMTENELQVTPVRLPGQDQDCGEISVKGFLALEKYIIPRTLGGYNICRIADDGFVKNTNNANPKQIKIEAEIEEVGKRAFKLSRASLSLKHRYIALPNSVKKIDEDAFMLSGLTVFIKPKNLNYIGKRAFAYPNGVDINGGVPTTCNPNMISHLNSFPTNDITEIFDETFACGNNNNTLDIPSGVTKIGVNAFLNCTSSGIIIPDTVTTIGNGAFQHSSGLNDGNPKIGGLVLKWRDKKMPENWKDWFGTTTINDFSKIRLSYYNKDEAFATAPLYYSTTTLSNTEPQSNVIDPNRVNGDIVLPSIIKGYYNKNYKIEYSTSDDTKIIITQPTVRTGQNYVAHISNGLAQIVRDSNVWHSVTLTASFVHLETGDTVTNDHVFRVEPISGIPDPDAQKPAPDPDPDTSPEDNENSEGSLPEDTNPPKVCTNVGQCGMNWLVVGGIGGALALALYLELKKKPSDDSND